MEVIKDIKEIEARLNPLDGSFVLKIEKGVAMATFNFVNRLNPLDGSFVLKMSSYGYYKKSRKKQRSQSP